MIFHLRQKKINVYVPLVKENTIIKQVLNTKLFGSYFLLISTFPGNLILVLFLKRSKKLWGLLRNLAFIYRPNRC